MRYQIKHAIVRYGADTILEDVNFEIRDTEKIAIVGRNGCGKTTLLKLINGDIQMDNIDSDEECGISMAGRQRIGFLKQISFEDTQITAENEILKVFEPIFACERRMAQLQEEMEHRHDDKSVMGEYDQLQRQMESLGGYTYRQDMETVFQRFGFPLEDLQKSMGEFSGGQQTKIAFVKLLLSKPDIMLLDEPTNHLDMPTIEWLEGYLKAYNKAVVIVSHDRMFLDRVIDVTYEIEWGRIKRYPGNYTKFMAMKEEAAIKQEKDYEEQQKEIKRLTEWIEMWKNTPTKVTQARSKQKQIDHMVLIEKPRRFDTKAFQGSFAPRITSYSDVLDLRGLKIGYDEILSSVSFVLKKGERVAILGENGKGKSTLLRTLIGQIPPLGGSFTIGTGVEWGYFDQQEAVAASLEPKKQVIDDLWDMYPTLKEVEIRNALGNFLFTGDEVFKELGQLSGGEKVRLALCKMLMKRPNLLILDEPTNHMDLVGKDALEKMLKDFQGTILFVSHDRYFVKEVATGILDFEKERCVFYPYPYEEYLEERDKAHARAEQKEAAKTVAATPKQAAGANPTLEDVFDKKTYYNPGKVLSRLKQQLAKYERLLEESEERLAALKLEQMDPALSSSYTKLMEITEKIEKEEHEQETILERMLEVETELAEFEA